MFDYAYSAFPVAALKVLRKFFWFVKPAEAMTAADIIRIILDSKGNMCAISLTISLFLQVKKPL